MKITSGADTGLMPEVGGLNRVRHWATLVKAHGTHRKACLKCVFPDGTWGSMRRLRRSQEIHIEYQAGRLGDRRPGPRQPRALGTELWPRPTSQEARVDKNLHSHLSLLIHETDTITPGLTHLPGWS